MSIQTATKIKCVTCGHIIDSSGARLSAIEFRRYVNSITDLNTLIGSKDYLTRFIRSRYRIKDFVDKFLNDLEIITGSGHKMRSIISPKYLVALIICEFGYLASLITQIIATHLKRWNYINSCNPNTPE
jgi:hypothetical protein